MNSDCQSKLALRAITLRAFGSYLHETRMEVRPLTILCGKNGSGKSTWIKAMNLLAKLRQEQGVGALLGFFRSRENYPWEELGYLPAAIYAALADEHGILRDGKVDDAQVAPICLIGLDLEAVEELSLPGFPEPPWGSADVLPQAFLWSGKCPKGTRISVRLAHPPLAFRHGAVLTHLVELQINSRHIIRLTERCKDAKVTDSRLEYSKSFAPDNLEVQSDPVVMLPGVDPFQGAQVDPNDHTAEGVGRAIFSQLLRQVKHLLDIFFEGYFSIGAIRNPPRSLEVEEAEPHETDSPSHDCDPRYQDEEGTYNFRHVGTRGERTYFLEHEFACNRLCPAEPYWGYPQEFLPKEVDRVMVETLVAASHGKASPAAEHALSLMPHELRAAIAGIGAESVEKDSTQVSIADALNSILHNPELYRPSLWQESDQEIQFLLRGGIERLRGKEFGELPRFNRMLIESLFHERRPPSGHVLGPGRVTFSEGKPVLVEDPRGPIAEPSPDEYLDRIGYLLDGYVSFWLKELTQTSIDSGADLKVRLSERWSRRSAFANALLACPEPCPIPELAKGGCFDNFQPRFDDESAVEFTHPCFGKKRPQPPSQLSAGFHQLAPIVVQTGLMRRNEVLTIENPEVHLHPSLQLDATEFLIHQARAGKNIIIETHSDLVIRRVLRAILEEEIPQSAVGIYFTDIEKAESGCHYSTLTPLCVNERGQIDNWPEGFLSDDLKESRRLMDAMYGANPDEAEE